MSYKLVSYKKKCVYRTLLNVPPKVMSISRNACSETDYKKMIITDRNHLGWLLIRNNRYYKKTIRVIQLITTQNEA